MNAIVRRHLALGALLGCAAGGTRVPADFLGYWAGTATFRGAVLDISVHFTQYGDSLAGVITARDITLLDQPLATVIYGPFSSRTPFVRFTLADPEGTLVFDGRRAGDTLTGTVALPTQVARQQGASGMTWRLVRRAPPAPPPYATRELRISAAGASLAATLFVPRATSMRRPAVLLLQGSSTNLRSEYRFQADQFARAGFVVLTFDKRGNGASTGNYRRATYDDLVADARAAFDTLASQPEVDARHVGLWGISQGALIAPLVAEKRAAFVIAVSSPGMPIAEAAAYQDSLRVAWAGRSNAEAARAAAAHRELAVALRAANSADAVSAFFRRIANEPWRSITALPRTPPEDDELRGWYWSGRTLDPVTWWRTLRVPVLLVYGAADELVPAQQSAELLARALRAGGNRDVTLRIYPRANHVVRLVTSPLAPAENGWQWPSLAPGYASDVMSWALARAGASKSER